MASEKHDPAESFQLSRCDAPSQRRAGAEAKSTAAAKFKDNPIEHAQHGLFPSNVFELLPAGHDCFLFKDILAQIDTREVELNYSPLGQRAYAPKQLVGILIYAYSRGVFSSRQIEQRCREDLGFMYIAGSNCPNFRVLSDFRKQNSELFHNCFKQTVQLALELKLASLGHVSLDGSKFKANSSKHKAMSYKNLQAQEAKLTGEIQALVAQAERADEEEDSQYKEQTGYEPPEDLEFKKTRLEKIRAAKQALEAREKARQAEEEEIDGKKQISFADHDARIMGKRGQFEYAYNAQISVDSEHQIIVGEHITQQANDYNEVHQGLEQISHSCGALPEKVSADNGYYSGGNLEAFEAAGVEAYVATNRDEKGCVEQLRGSARRLVKADFDYNEERDCFVCPQGQTLEFKQEDKSGRRQYQGEISVCQGCPLKPQCSRSKKNVARIITTDSKEGQRRRMNARMAQRQAKEIYDKRKVIVEPVFGQIKNSGFGTFSMRGKVKVAGEFSLVCAVHNLKKIVKAATEGLIRPEHGQWAEVAG